jgi:preprotein translocase subunit SecA
MFGSSNERRVKAIGYTRDKQGKTIIIPGSVLDRINQLEPQLEQLSEQGEYMIFRTYPSLSPAGQTPLKS